MDLSEWRFLTASAVHAATRVPKKNRQGFKGFTVIGARRKARSVRVSDSTQRRPARNRQFTFPML